MRHSILTNSTIAQRVYRHVSSLDGDLPFENTPSSEGEGEGDWTWPEAEKRLDSAMDKGGAYAWAEAALVEMEREAEKNRRERGIYDISNEK